MGKFGLRQSQPVIGIIQSQQRFTGRQNQALAKAFGNGHHPAGHVTGNNYLITTAHFRLTANRNINIARREADNGHCWDRRRGRLLLSRGFSGNHHTGHQRGSKHDTQGQQRFQKCCHKQRLMCAPLI